jgi:hypothetical protein
VDLLCDERLHVRLTVVERAMLRGNLFEISVDWLRRWSAERS